MKLFVIISSLALWLNACTTVDFKPNYPTLVTYTIQEQQQAAKGLQWMITNQQPTGYDVILRMLADYGQLRAMTRSKK